MGEDAVDEGMTVKQLASRWADARMGAVWHYDKAVDMLLAVTAKERERWRALIEAIPCALGAPSGGRVTGCRECPRCVALLRTFEPM